VLISALGRAIKNSAFSLTELLIALLLGSLLLIMVISLYVTGITTATKSMKMSRLRADLHAIIAMIETDIRRAGYGGSDYLVGSSGTKTIDINSDNNCIVYYYNHNGSPSLENSNKMAFSLKNNSVKFKTNVAQVADIVCAVSSGWSSISDDKFIKITNLSFTEAQTSNAVATMRSVEIALAGELISDSRYSHAIATRIQVRNVEFTH